MLRKLRLQCMQQSMNNYYSLIYHLLITCLSLVNSIWKLKPSHHDQILSRKKWLKIMTKGPLNRLVGVGCNCAIGLQPALREPTRHDAIPGSQPHPLIRYVHVNSHNIDGVAIRNQNWKQQNHAILCILSASSPLIFTVQVRECNALVPCAILHYSKLTFVIMWYVVH